MNRRILGMQPSGIRRVAEMARGIEGCISLTLGEPAFDTPLPIREATKRALDENHTHYPPNLGLLGLRKAIAEFMGKQMERPVSYKNILVTCGSTEALACAILGIVEPGDEVIVPMPAFGLYMQQLEIAGGVCVGLQTAEHGFQIDGDALHACIGPRTKAIILNTPNNPTGVQYTQETVDIVSAACLEHDLFLIHDAVYDRLAYDGPPAMPTGAVLGERLIQCNAFSKPYAMTGWRMGYCVAAEPVVKQLGKVHAALTVGVSTFSQVGCLDIFDVPVDGMLREYRANRDFIYDRLCGMGMDVVRPQGAFYAFPSIEKYGMDDDTFVSRLMHEHKVAVVPGNCFGTPGYIRLSYCCDRETLEEGLNRLEAFLQDEKK